MYQVVASDLDGTLLSPPYVIPYAKETLKLLTARGINFGVCDRNVMMLMWGKFAIIWRLSLKDDHLQWCARSRSGW